MPTRTTETTLTFRRAFKLPTVDLTLPAGTYRVVTDKEEIPNISFLTYRRSSTMLHTPALTAPGGTTRVFTVSSAELANALQADLQS